MRAKSGLLLWGVPLLCILLGAGLGALAAKVTPTTYQATATLVIGAARPDRSTRVVDLTDAISNRMDTYSNLVTTAAVLNPVVEQLVAGETLESLTKKIDTTVPVGSTIISVTASGPDPDLATEISNTVISSLSTQIGNLSPRQANNKASVKVTVLQDANDGLIESRPNTVVYCALGAALALGVAWIIARLSDIRGVLTPKPPAHIVRSDTS